MVMFGKIIIYKVFEGTWIPSRNLSVSGICPLRFAEEQVSLDLGPNRAVLSTSRRRYQEVPQPSTTEHPPAISTTHLFHKGDEHVVYQSFILLLFRDYIGRPYQSENEGHFVNDEPVYVPRSTMVDIIYRWNISSPRPKSQSGHICYPVISYTTIFYYILYTIYYILL